MTNTDESRKGFEEWFNKRWPEFNHDKSSAFEVWQASRAKPIVLPEEQEIPFGLQSSVDALVDSNLYQAKLIQAQHKLLLESGIECGSKEIVAGMRRIESLKQQRDELLTALKDLVDGTEEPLDSNCSCHINFLCADYVNYLHMRGIGGNEQTNS